MRLDLTTLKQAIAGLAFCTLLIGCHSKQDVKLATTAAADAPLLSIPIQRDEYWIAEARSAEDKPFHVLLDTGATFNVLNDHGPLSIAPITHEAKAAFSRSGLPIMAPGNGFETITVTTPSGPMEVKLGLSPALHIQGWAIPAGTLALQKNISSFSLGIQQPVDAVFGIESMRNLTWRGDYVAGQLTAYADATPAHEWQQCTFMTLETNQRMPIIKFDLGDGSIWLGLDTGSGADVNISEETFDALVKEKFFDQIAPGFFTDITGRILPEKRGLLAGLAVGPTKLPKLLVSRGATSMIGLGLLQKMDRFELDFRHYRFCFDLPSAPRDSRLSSTGAALLPSGDHYNVAAIAPDGRLAASGIKLGDQLMKVGATSVTTLKSAALHELLGSPAASEVTVQRGNDMLIIGLKPVPN